MLLVTLKMLMGDIPECAILHGKGAFNLFFSASDSDIVEILENKWNCFFFCDI